jgi:Linalool dehydratase/isomerase
METSFETPAATVPPQHIPPALIPERNTPDGPATTQQLRRTVIGYLALLVAGTAIARRAGKGRAANLGVGMIAPGAGYLCAGKPLRFLSSVAGFAVSLLMWLGSGNVLAPITVWLGTALGALRHDVRRPMAKVIVPFASVAAICGGLALRRRAFESALQRRSRRNEFLQTLGATNDGPIVSPRSEPIPQVPELSADQLALVRFALERALQPVNEFEGYDKIEQFQLSSIRYQVAVNGYALTAVQYAHTPAFHGYLSLAQRNTIAKWQERICWAFWSKESMWGHLRYNPDPIPRDDIMVSGWLGNQIAGYTAVTRDRYFTRPGSITFQHPRGMRYEYDLHSLTEILARNFAASKFGLFPCEPNWIYALCNGFGILPLPIHDHLYGTDYVERIMPSFRRGFENEFLSADGRTVGIRSKWTGFSIPAMTSILSDASVIWQIHPVMPDIARRQWEILKREMLTLRSDGRLDAKMSGWDRIDTGNYRRSGVSALLWVQAAATELGDTDIAAAAGARIAEEGQAVTEGGVRRLAKGSAQANLAWLMSNCGRANAHYDRVNYGIPDTWAQGPILDVADYPQVLVARAVTDGAALDLVLRPGDGGGRRRLGFARLRPGITYAVHGGVEHWVVASADGTASAHVDLYGRRELHLTPTTS